MPRYLTKKLNYPEILLEYKGGEANQVKISIKQLFLDFDSCSYFYNILEDGHNWLHFLLIADYIIYPSKVKIEHISLYISIFDLLIRVDIIDKKD